MKCISCGGEVGLTDEKCPFCGRVVTETAGYRTDLKDYREKSEKIKRRLAEVLAGNIPLIISAVVMLALLIANGIAFYVKDNAYTFRSDAMRDESVKNYDAYSAEIEKYLEAGDYSGFVAFKEYHNIAEWEAPYDDLKLLWEIAYRYDSLVSNVESAVMFGQDARRYRPQDDISDCQYAIHGFYHEYEARQTEIEGDTYEAYIRDMKEKADILLKIYLGIDDADRDAFLAASDIEQEAYLEGVLIDEKE
ncbi:MAG: hypothetical protein K5696_00750 [Lachnospiraceae bacterium]|nr:hypothetical protein [Lachnospiraceae bacterium]